VLLTSVVLLLVIMVWNLLFPGQGRTEIVGAAVMAIPGIASLIMALVFWRCADYFARRMVSDDPTPATSSAVTLEGVLGVAFAAIGVFVLIGVLPEIAGVFLRVVRSRYAFSEWWASTEWQAEFSSLVLKTVLGIWLLLGSKGLVRALKKFRTFGVRDPVGPT
jgi:CDP-diglyceride synthetase